MRDWTSGYVADIGYTYGYYNELNPLRLRLAFLNAGLRPPDTGTACELGFGQGISANIHAAASAVQWFGTDFNPAQAAFAQELAATAGSEAQLFDQAFVEFCNRSDLPDFDYIGLHGIWSWISDENRAVIVDFVRRKLKVGGVLYVSYNTQPGWGAMVPLRDLLTEHSEVIGSTGEGIVTRIDNALTFADKLFTANPAYARANPQVVERFKKLKEHSRNYLAHEYFNRDWLPMPFSRMASWLASTKLTYACSAYYLDHLDVLNLTIEQQALLKEIPDAMFRETVRDFMVNQQFRRDYWVKGARKLTATEQTEKLRSQRVVLVQCRDDVLLKTSTSLGEVTMQESVYAPILNALADYKPKTLGQLEQTVKDMQISFAQVVQSAMVLTGSGVLLAAQESTLSGKAKKHVEQLNRAICNKARFASDISYLASPITGCGIFANRFQQLFLLAWAEGKQKPADWASFAWQILAEQQQRLIKEGKMLETTDENIAELTAQAQEFADKRLPILKALQVI